MTSVTASGQGSGFQQSGHAAGLEWNDPVHEFVAGRDSRTRRSGDRRPRWGRGEEELATYDEVIRCYRGDPELELRRIVAQAMLNKGSELRSLEVFEEMIFNYAQDVDQVILVSERQETREVRGRCRRSR
jgi:hypothetical protein